MLHVGGHTVRKNRTFCIWNLHCGMGVFGMIMLLFLRDY